MSQKPQAVPVGGSIILLLLLLTAFILENAFVKDEGWYWYLCFTLPAIVLAATLFSNKKSI